MSGGKGRSIVNQSFSATVSIIQGKKKGQLGLDFRYAAVTDDQSQVTQVTNSVMTFANITILGGFAASLVLEHAPEMERGETCLIRKTRNALRLLQSLFGLSAGKTPPSKILYEVEYRAAIQGW